MSIVKSLLLYMTSESTVSEGVVNQLTSGQDRFLAVDITTGWTKPVSMAQRDSIGYNLREMLGQSEFLFD